MVWPHPPADCILLRRRRRRHCLLRSLAGGPCHRSQNDGAFPTCESARHRPQHPVHLVLDAVPRLTWLVDRQAHAPVVWSVCFHLRLRELTEQKS